MKPPRLRSGLITATLLIMATAAWLYLAPMQIGGSTIYVVTHGNSMEPRFHTGDLALVRSADDYEVGQIVAYHSALLHAVLLHRIIAREGGRYVFKGDHNNFVDPTRPRRGDLIGALWLRVPQGGRILAALHTPLMAFAAALVGGMLLLLGAREKRRRRKRRRNRTIGAGRQQGALMQTPQRDFLRPTILKPLRAASFAATLLLFAVSLIAFTRPLRKPAMGKLPYTQQVTFGYSARAPAGAVYPSGVVRTGDPIFLRLVHRVGVRIDYHFAVGAPHKLAGSERVLLQVSGPTGWSRSIVLAPSRRFAGDRVGFQVTLDLPSVQSLLEKVQALTGVSAGAGYTLAVAPQIEIHGTVANQPIQASDRPALSLQLQPLQLELGGPSGSASQGGLTPSRRATIPVPTTTPNMLGAGGAELSVATIRWIGLAGFLLTGICAVVVRVLVKLHDPLAEVQRIHAKYGHLIVPVVAAPAAVASAPFDVTSIEALVRLAQSGERLILHHRDEFTDTYLLTDDTAVYRYQTQVPVVWGEWSAPRQQGVHEEPEPAATRSTILVDTDRQLAPEARGADAATEVDERDPVAPKEET